MNIVQLQDQLKNFSQDQLVREMQMPSGNTPQFLVLGEIMRRKRMQDDFTAQQAKGDQGTVAQEAVAAAGVPQGGIADMARALAPSTDIAQNTGVQAMYAGGPVKKMAEGDIVVRGGKRYIEQEDGTYLSEDGGARILTPGQAMRRDVEALTNIDVGGGLRSVFQPVGDTLRGVFQPVGEAARETLQPVGETMRETLQPVGQDLQTLFEPRPAPPQSEFTTEDINAAIEAAATKNRVSNIMEDIQAERAPEAPTAPARVTRTAPRAAGIGSAAVVPGSVDGGILSAIVDPALSGLGEFGRALGGETVEERDARRAAEAAAEAAPGRADRDQQGAAAVPTPAEVKEAETARVAEAAKDAAAAAQGGTGGAGGGGGGIAGVGGMSSYEQELMDTLARREKAAEQDKWLALAQVGLNMMASRQPTLLGAVGEAGLKGVEAVRGARDQYDKDRLELLGALEKSRMARAAATARTARGAGGASDGGLFSLSAGQGRLLTQIGNDIERLDALIANAAIMPPATPEAEMALANAQKERDRKVALWNTLVYGGGATSGADSGIPDLSDQD